MLNLMQSAIFHIMRGLWKEFTPAVLLVLSGLSMNAHAQTNDLAGRLSSRDYVLMMRHAQAPGVGDPAEFNLNDCKTQRNLSEEGIKQALRIGEWLKQQGVTKANVYSSPWCRTTDTAKLLGFGPVISENSLASTFEEKNTANLDLGNLSEFVAKSIKKKGSKALILVTHQVNISAYTGLGVAAGDMVLIKVNRDGKMLSSTPYSRAD